MLWMNGLDQRADCLRLTILHCAQPHMRPDNHHSYIPYIVWTCARAIAINWRGQAVKQCY
jgi:hypothetical protein